MQKRGKQEGFGGAGKTADVAAQCVMSLSAKRTPVSISSMLQIKGYALKYGGKGGANADSALKVCRIGRRVDPRLRK